MSDGCLRCGGSPGPRDPWDEPTTRTVERGWRHVECEARRKYEEWKRLMAEWADTDADELTLNQYRNGDGDAGETPTTADAETEGR